MKVCCGTDIIEIERIKQNIENKKTGKNFIQKVYTQNEIDYCESKKATKYQHYAGRFAAKEAVFKAVSEQLEDKYSISWHNIEVLNDDKGKPHINIIGVKLKDIEDMDISISHCKEYVVANVVLLKV